MTVTFSPVIAKGVLNHCSNVVHDWKMEGSIKFIRAHSSGRLFCMGRGGRKEKDEEEGSSEHTRVVEGASQWQAKAHTQTSHSGRACGYTNAMIDSCLHTAACPLLLCVLPAVVSL